MTTEEHKKIHGQLHTALDELFADYISNHPGQRGFIDMPLEQLLEWSAKMAENPDHEPDR